MKKISLLFPVVCLLLVIYSCSTSNHASKNKTASASSIRRLLIAKQWIPDTIYVEYYGPGTGKLLYIRGRKNNLWNDDNDRGIFWSDGSEDAFNANGYKPWTWSLNGSDSTGFIGHTDVGNITNHVKILFLDSIHLTMFDSTYHTYAANVAKQ
jgi:hypothetical protein